MSCSTGRQNPLCVNGRAQLARDFRYAAGIIHTLDGLFQRRKWKQFQSVRYRTRILYVLGDLRRHLTMCRYHCRSPHGLRRMEEKTKQFQRTLFLQILKSSILFGPAKLDFHGLRRSESMEMVHAVLRDADWRFGALLVAHGGGRTPWAPLRSLFGILVAMIVAYREQYSKTQTVTFDALCSLWNKLSLYRQQQKVTCGCVFWNLLRRGRTFSHLGRGSELKIVLSTSTEAHCFCSEIHSMLSRKSFV